MNVSNRAISGALSDFELSLSRNFGLTLRKYQRVISEAVLEHAFIHEDGIKLNIITMPTGSGKTFIEMAIAYFIVKLLGGKVLVLEPTRLLCDQMKKIWSGIFEDIAKGYEGRCEAFQRRLPWL